MANDGFVARFEIAGAPDGPLSGLTFGAKDIFDLEGHVTGAGHPDWARTHKPAAHHAEAVSILLRGGARMVGKTHSDELCYSLFGLNHHFGAPVNPAAPDRLPGGSSSGSASATAAGLIDIGLGSDTAGSVRLPASFCGLYGMRPSHGAIAMDGVLPMAPSFDTVGWMTRDAETCALVGAAFGVESADMEGLPDIVAPQETWDEADEDVRAALSSAAAAIELDLSPRAGLRLTDGSLGEWREAFRIHQAWEIWRTHGAWIESVQPEFGPGVAKRFAIAREISDADAAEAHETREAATKRMRDALQGETVLAIPTSPSPAPLLTTDAEALDAFRYRAIDLLCIAGLAGLPQITIPLAEVDGAPVGLSLIGGQGEDRMLLAVAKVLGSRLGK